MSDTSVSNNTFEFNLVMLKEVVTTTSIKIITGNLGLKPRPF